MTVAPFYPSFTDLEEISYYVPGEMGPETEVDFTYDAELEAGTRRAGVPLHRVETGADLATTLVEIVARTRRPVRGRSG